MPRHTSSFSVVCLARESPEVLLHFIDYYLNLGADSVYIYYDGERSELSSEFVREIQGKAVYLTFCDELFWQTHLGEMANVLHKKQIAIYQKAHAACRSKWLFVTDADEYILPYQSVQEILERIPDSIDSFSLAAVEAVWGPNDDLERAFGSTWFRRRFQGRWLWGLLGFMIYGSLKKCFTQNILGHLSGKHFIKCDADFDNIGNHRSMRNGVSVTVPLTEVFPNEPCLEVGHFDAISFPRWKEKFGRRILCETLVPTMRNARQRQLAMIADSFQSSNRSTANTPRRLFAALYSLNRFQLLLLRLSGNVFKYEISNESLKSK
jgi:hypothetical protein